MGKLHEALAANETLKGQADQCRADLSNTFDKKRHLFGEKLVTYKPDAEGQPTVTESQSALQTTVIKELAWIAGHWSKAIDCSFSINEANMNARADIVLDDGTVLAKSVPATSLLELGKRAAEIAELIKAIPTLDPAKGFTVDSSREIGVYKALPETKNRTAKVQEALVLLQPTKEHPGQAVQITRDVRVGVITEQEWSGLITPARKADLLERAEQLVRAIKTARARANEATVPDVKIAKLMFDYVLR